ncbi:MAG TPA: cytochrome P450, partial [Thermoleophilaceae bacterium]|nr:cytochrome P450 [Thermoleophilaceae bacterium]
LVELGQDPGQLARARTAARDGDDQWLEAVLKESMRLHPVIPMVVRTLMAPATIAGHDLPAGVTVAPSIIVSHQRADQHPDPEVFRPERFLGQNPPTNTWIPFGGGVRRCIGASFALFEMRVVLSTLLARAGVRAAEPEREALRRRTITMTPSRGARVVLQPL